MIKHALYGALAAIVMTVAGVGCGGHKDADTTPQAQPQVDPQTVTGDTMFPPEAMDEIQRDLDHKAGQVSDCLGVAIGNQELPKNSHGKVTLEIVIAPNGTTSSVKVINTTLDSKSLTECVIQRVKSIAFPTLPRPYERSYTYGFEAS
jgi:hypothetical protein